MIRRAIFPGITGIFLAGLLLAGLKWQAAVVLAESRAGQSWLNRYRTPGATTRYVWEGGANAGDCSSSGSPCETIQYAVNQSDAGDEIRIAAGTYNQINNTGGISQVVYIDKSIILWGGFTESNWNESDPENNPTVIDAQFSGRVVFMIGSENAVITGLQIINGDFENPFEDERGAGLHIETSNAVISRTIIHNNSSSFVGGGISLYQSTALVVNNEITDNSATTGAGGNSGGGIAASQSTLIASDNIINENYSGGVHCVISICQFYANTISDNEAPEGAGIHLTETDDVIIVGNLLERNDSSEKGGGIYLEDCDDALIQSNTFIDNEAFTSNAPMFDDEGEGGGIYAASGSTTIIDNTITGGLAAYGGGIRIGSSSIVTGNEIFSNVTTDGGGGGINAGSDVQIIANVIYSNTAASGGGILLAGDDNIVDGNHIFSNFAGKGGGIVDNAANTVVNNFILGNTANNGGGAYITGFDLNSSLWVNNIIAGNQAANVGSGIYNYSVDTRFIHNTIASNSGGDGSGIYLNGDSFSPAQIVMTNTIIVSQTIGIYTEAGGFGAIMEADLEATLWGAGGWENGTDVAGFGVVTTGTINIYGNPLFLDPGGGDFHVGTGSPAIDAGIDAGVGTDIDGEGRPFGAGFDIGADENVGDPTPTPTASATPTATLTPLVSPTHTPTPTGSPTATPSPTGGPSPTPTATPSPTSTTTPGAEYRIYLPADRRED